MQVIIMRQGIQSKQSVSNAEVPFESVCTCKKCNHGLARDCVKSGCKCCKKGNHSMVMDGIEGFLPIDREERSHGK
jgi:hypothetical protein